VQKVYPTSFVFLFRIFLIGLLFMLFHLLAPHSYAFQPTVGAWTQVGLNNEYITTIAVDPNNPSILYAGLGAKGIYKSTDGGDNWTAINNGLPDPTTFAAYALAINPQNTNVIYAALYGVGIFKTTDGGANWTNITNGINDLSIYYLDMVMDTNNPDTVYVGVYSNCSGVYKTTNGGASWTHIPPGCDVYGMAFDPVNSYVYAGTATVAKSVDGGTTWTGAPPLSPGGGVAPIAIDPNDHNTLYAKAGGGSQDGLFKSTDGGTTWAFVPSYPGGPGGNQNMVTDPIRPNTVYVGSRDTSTVYETSDGGTNWSQLTGLQTPGGILKLLMPANNHNVLYAGTGAGLYAYGFNDPQTAPVINPIPNKTINVGDTYTASGTFTESGASSWTATVDYGDGSGVQSLPLSGMNFSLSNQYTSGGIYTVIVSVTDNLGATGTTKLEVTVTAPPHINSFSGSTINEGDTYSASGSFTDPTSSSWTATVDYGDGSGVQSLPLSGMNFSLSNVYKDNGTFTVTVRVTNNQGETGTGTATVIVNNVNPSVGIITAPSSPVLVNTAITASANFTDPGVLDTHTTSWNWGDGNTTTGTVTESNGSGSVSNNHTYTATGVYTITLTVTDKDGGQGTSTYQYVAVYDSSTSFAGGRSFDNPANASPNTTGKVTFGISSKYNNSNALTGSVKMNFKAANLDFASTSLSSLATSTGKAYLKGSGTVNGVSGYTFLATGIDGSVVGGNDLIRFQIKDASNNVVYDSQPGAGDTADPTTVDASGNIRVH